MIRKELKEKIKNYKTLKADILDFNIKLEDLKDSDGLKALENKEATGKTNKINRPVELIAENNIKKEKELKIILRKLDRQVRKIENGLSVLDEEEKTVIDILLINNYPSYKAQDKLRLSYGRVKQLESKALNKMEKYIK